MVLKSLIRYTTSFVGALVHTIAGLAAVLAVPTLALLVVFLAPSLVGGLGVNNLFDGTVTEVVTDLSAQTPLSTVGLGVGLFGLLALFVFGQKAGYIFYDIGRPDASGSANAAASARATASAAETASTRTKAEVNLTRFRNVSAFMVGLLAVLFLVFLVADVPQQLVGGPVLALALFVATVQIVVYAVAAYSAHNRWAEGVVVGTVLYFVTLVTSIVTLNPFGILIGGVGLKHGVRGVGAAEFAILSMEVDEVRERVGAATPDLRGSRPGAAASEDHAGTDDGTTDPTGDRNNATE